MFLVGIITWWYGDGWKGQLGRIKGRLKQTLGYFSIGQLLKTFFSPFRQISAGKVRGSLATQLRAFFDQTLSRVIGAIVRFFTIIAGIIVLIVQLIGEVIVLVVWLILPLLPIAGLVVMAIGWVPKWL